jgi:phosphohistidine swiveling domain-containing protein
MSRETNTPWLGVAGRFILPIHPGRGPRSAAIGGKARSLARLAALGLPVPPAFVVGPALWRDLRASGPPVPRRLESGADLTALDAARDALLNAAFPAEFESELRRALDAVQGAVPGTASSLGGAFAVRSSGDTEDRAGALGAGIYLSLLRVSRSQVPDAIRQVLGSFLTPAAWTFSGSRKPSPPGPAVRVKGGAVLVHPFVDADAAGTAALDARAAPQARAPDGGTVRMDTNLGSPTATARAVIEAATRVAARAYGPVEIEWAAHGDTVTFLQLRAYCPAPEPVLAARTAGPLTSAFSQVMAPTTPEGPWIWDAAHNPRPLSPAQAGLVEVVDERCATAFRQQVVHGYLFFRATDAAHVDSAKVVDPRAAFDQLRADMGPRLDALGAEPGLEAALNLYVSGYGPLFGVVGPACVAARQALEEFLGGRFPGPVAVLPDLLAGVPSVAGLRRTAAMAIAAAANAADRQAAIDAYLGQFGDESPRWDVAEATLREAPQRLLPLTLPRPAAPASTATASGVPDSEAAHAARMARELRDRLAPPDQERFLTLLAAARAAIAVGEDDDALFARLQTAVRRALLAVGRWLVSTGRLDDVDDVFYLPLGLARALSDQRHPGATDQVPVGASVNPPDGQDLRMVAAAGRRALDAAGKAPPPVVVDRGARIVRGRAGAGGRIVGRAVHHPASAPFDAESILIAATLLPTELPLLSPAAIIVETGHPLGHVAAQARERGIPAVVGAVGAVAAIPEQSLIVVDGDRGEVLLLSDT